MRFCDGNVEVARGALPFANNMFEHRTELRSTISVKTSNEKRFNWHFSTQSLHALRSLKLSSTYDTSFYNAMCLHLRRSKVDLRKFHISCFLWIWDLWALNGLSCWPSEYFRARGEWIFMLLAWISAPAYLMTSQGRAGLWEDDEWHEIRLLLESIIASPASISIS